MNHPSRRRLVLPHPTATREGVERVAGVALGVDGGKDPAAEGRALGGDAHLLGTDNGAGGAGGAVGGHLERLVSSVSPGFIVSWLLFVAYRLMK